MLSSPYHYSGAILARLTVSIATALWSMVVLYKEDALRTWPLSQETALHEYENAAAAAMLILCATAIGRLLAHARPVPFGACLYCAMALVWVYTLVTLITAVFTGVTALRPGQIGAVTVVTALSLFAFIANPKRDP